MRIFLIGGTGQVGSLVASALVDRGGDVRVLTRDPARAEALPRGQTGVVGNMFAVSVLRREMSRADGVFILYPPSEDLCFQGLTALAVAKECLRGQLVMMTGQDCDRHIASGHIGSLVPPEHALLRSGLRHTLLYPNYFYQNDEKQRDSMLRDGIYGTPLGDVGLSRCDVRDISEAVVAAFARGGTGEQYRICGPDVLNGETIASIWSRSLGRPVRYGGHDDMDGFERQLVAGGTPEHWALDIRTMYESFQRDGLIATESDRDRLAALIGHAPRTMAQYADEMASRWLAAELPEGVARC